MTRILPTLMALCLLTPLASAQDWQFDDVRRVVAMSDVHGAYDAMVSTLRQAAVIGPDSEWTGDDTHFIVVGDILDRGPKSRAAMDLLMRLEVEAAEAGGTVQVLIGNHESMLLTGDMRYVSDAEYAAFEADEDPEDREHWFALYVAQQAHDDGSLRAAFDDKYPPGYFAMRRAFRADGKYGKWLLQKNTVALVNGTAFVHGGLAPEIAGLGLQAINETLIRELSDYVGSLAVLADEGIVLPTDSHYDYASILANYVPPLDESAAVLDAVARMKRVVESRLLDTGGPLWYRGNATCPGLVEEHRLAATLQAIGAERLVVGHTPTPNRQVLQRFDGRLIEIDTGMLGFYYNGSGNALVLEDATVTVVNQSGEVFDVPVQHPRRIGHRAAGLSQPALVELLQNGEIVSLDKNTPVANKAPPRTIVTVSDGNDTVSALFSSRPGKGFYPGVAAYRLDRLLELDMVPVTVIREIDGQAGSLQFMPANTESELTRSEAGHGAGAGCPLPDQWPAMSVFDALIHNDGRLQQRMLYDQSTWRLILSEHERAFPSRKGRPAHLKAASLDVHPGWQETLRELTDDRLTQELGDVLDKKRLKALFARRDRLLPEAP